MTCVKKQGVKFESSASYSLDQKISHSTEIGSQGI